SFFVGARTHSTIAAYSSNVPTLVIGYSVKSRGIATDLFGDYTHYVLPVQEISEPDEMIRAYRWIIEKS
ncbi:MAG: polysaccharide pyruvyl transferase family protein, partial [Butyrivibrio sp.]|nr:polysaccharide pyruvyl transferase family protein [Butyrivibrio sp.]